MRFSKEQEDVGVPRVAERRSVHLGVSRPERQLVRVYLEREMDLSLLGWPFCSSKSAALLTRKLRPPSLRTTCGLTFLRCAPWSKTSTCLS